MHHAIIKSSRVQVEARKVVCQDGEKSARLLEEQGVVRAIELRCACGEVTVFELEYPEQTESTPSNS
jgi:hypothetical protein